MTAIPELGRFDPMGPAVRSAVLPGGRTVHFIDEGEPDWPVMLFFGGAATSVRAFGLLEFARGLREALGIRVVSVERNGLGQTQLRPAAGHAEYAEDVLALLERLEIKRMALMAISGGGPYAAHVAARAPDRITSVHLACAFSERLPEVPMAWLELSDEEAAAECARTAADPAGWWQYPPDSPTQRIPGFADACGDEGRRALQTQGVEAGARALEHERRLLAEVPLPDLGAVGAPAYLYWGGADELVPTAHLERWRRALPNVARVRLYAGEGHDVQYRHWEQILVDVAGTPDRILVCDRGQTRLVAEADVAGRLAAGATLGSCAWA